MDRPRAGVHYPRSLGEFEAWFSTDRDCLDYLQWLRWPEGFACPDCGHVGGWQLGDGRFWCTGCAGRTSVTAGTIFDRARTPLTVWFAASWLFATQKDGISALSLRRELEIGSYQTAWAMLHRLRSVLVRPGRDRLAGAVEVDETYIGGEEAGLAGGRAKGKKSLVGIAVEVREPKGLGRCRMGLLADASAGSLHPFVSAHVEPGSRVITDAWQGYAGIDKLGYVHERRSQRATRARGGARSSCSPGRTGSPRWPSGGCSAPTRAPSTKRTCRATWTSSCSASAGATPVAEGWCSTGCSSSPSRTARSATGTSWRAPSRKGTPLVPKGTGASHRASSALLRTARGERPLTSFAPVEWIPPMRLMHRLAVGRRCSDASDAHKSW